jgi:hypothetical protein
MSVQLDAMEANRLYWETEASVAEIAARFDLSRRGLYEVVRPFDAGVQCNSCGGALAYENRLSRRAGQAMCAACGTRQAVSNEATSPPAFAESQVAQSSDVDDARSDDRAYHEEDSRSNDLRQRAVLLGGAAIAGIALGTVATLLARRRD